MNDLNDIIFAGASNFFDDPLPRIQHDNIHGIARGVRADHGLRRLTLAVLEDAIAYIQNLFLSHPTGTRHCPTRHGKDLRR